MRFLEAQHFLGTKEASSVILVALGSNLNHPEYGSPLQICKAALKALEGAGLFPMQCSRWFETTPIPASDQPNFINGVIELAPHANLTPEELLTSLHGIEAYFGRVRSRRNEARLLDLDIIDFNGLVTPPERVPELPHRRMKERAFVLYPLRDVAPHWRHPITGESIDKLIAGLPEEQKIRALA